MYIDSHAHIYLQEFSEDLAHMLARGKEHGVHETYMPNIDGSTVEALHRVEEEYDSCKAMMGLHPCYVKEDYKEQLALVEQCMGQRRYAAVGEVGVDLYWDKTFVDEQLIAFRRQIALAKEYGLAVIIHSRDSLDVTIEEVSKLQTGSLKGIFHCFNGTVEQGKAIVDLGFYLGIGGVLTYKNAGVDKTVSQLPLENMVLETDAPYLSPTPYRGKRNEVAHISVIGNKLSEVLEVSTSTVATVTTANCEKIFAY